MKVISIANQKGGVGKTTLTRELSSCCAIRGYQVLAIDCDPQGSLTASWVEPEIYEGTLAHVLLDPEQHSRKTRIKAMTLDKVVVESPLQNLDLVPADIRLSPFELAAEFLTHRLANQINEYCQEYDLVFLDCPPHLGKLLTAALYAADWVLIPCVADVLGLHGLADLQYFIERIQTEVNRKLATLGVVMNLYHGSRKLSAEARTAVEVEIGKKLLFDCNIHNLVKNTEAPSHRLPVALYAPDSQAAIQWESLADEFLTRIKIDQGRIKAVK